MAFPTTVPANGDTAVSMLMNQLSQNGLSTAIDDGVVNAMAGTLANMMQTLPDGANVGRTVLATTAGAGFTGGTGTIYAPSVTKMGNLLVTRILVDLTGLASVATDLDIIGMAAGGVSHLGQITAAVNGTILGGEVTCYEVPAGGAVDIDVYVATEATGAYDTGIATLTETAVVTSSGNWTLGRVLPCIADSVAANSYIYLTSGAATAGTYTAGRLMITLYGV